VIRNRMKMRSLFVVIVRGPVFERVQEIDAAETVIGRADKCGVKLPDLIVSREHAVFLKTGDEFRIRDLKSRNGTIVNGNKIAEEILASGSLILIGPYTLTVYPATYDSLMAAINVDDCPTQSHSALESPPFGTPLRAKIAQLLTPAQRRVFDLLVQGLIEKEVARHLGISPNTVHEHVKAIYRTLLVSTRGELISRWAK
jgi:pSer/pThr/pTyr-binding forkhead associated (FHA) protein